MNSRVPFGKSKLVGFKYFKSILVLITCSQSFLLEISLLYDHFFVEAVARFYLIQYVGKLFTPFSKGCYVQFRQAPLLSVHILFEATAHLLCIEVGSHWQTSTSDSSLLNLVFKFLIPLVNLDIVLEGYSWNLRNKSMIWDLVKDLRVYFV